MWAVTWRDVFGSRDIFGEEDAIYIEDNWVGRNKYGV